ncbi:MAG: DUF4286 family protein [Bacteroidota bacterium]
MLVYNVTVGVDKSIEAEWIAWMKGTHIPNVLRTGMFVESKMYKVLTHDDEASVSYAIQYYALNLDNVQNYLENFAPRLREEAQLKFGNRQAAYRTLLEEV